jgi:hypothetical protein
LKRLRHFLAQSLCGTCEGRASVNALSEAIEGSDDAAITDATTVFIGSSLSESERKDLAKAL